MTDLKTDQEKAEEIKLWWKENGISVVAGVAIAIAAVFGWQQWQKHQSSTIEQASTLFNQTQKNFDDKVLTTIKNEHSSTPYASLASLAAAKHAAEQGNNELALSELNWVIDNTSDNNIKEVATIRLIRVQISAKQYDKAEQQLSQTYSTAYTPLIDELKGDLYHAQNKSKEAIDSYQRAILNSGGNPPRYLQMKLDSLGSGA